MADRTVKVSLTAQVSNYVANMKEASKATEKVGESLKEQKAASIAAAKAQGEASQEIGRGLVAVGAIAAVAVGIAVAKWAQFDEAMSNVKAATQESAANMDLLRDAALQAGADTVFSAVEAANAIEELGKNGLTTAQILEGGLDGALALASAGQLDVARAAEIASISMKQFGLAGSDIPHIADLLAAGAGKAAGDVEDLAQALNQSALVADQTGLSIEETTGVLAAFADAGLKGSDAGTSLKSALQRLTPVSAEGAEEMARLGISAYDSQGNFIGAAKFAGVLQDKLGDLTVEQRAASMAQIFGSDAVRAANVLYEQGAEGIQKYVDQTNDSGYAAKVAADRLNNLNGDLEKLGGAFDTYLIKSGSGANDMLRSLVQGATGLVDVIGSLPAPVLGTGLALTGLVSVVALAGGAALIAVPKVAAFRASLSTLGISGSTAAKGIGLASGALAVAGIAFAIWAGKQAQATAVAAEFKESLDQATGATTDYTRELVAKKLAESGAFDAAKEAGVSQKELTDAVLEGGDALDSVNKKINGNNTLIDFFSGVGFRAGNARDSIKELSTGLDRSEKDFDDQAAAAEGAAEGTGYASEAYNNAADKAAELESNLRELIDALQEANGQGQDAISLNNTYADSLADVDEHIKNAKAGVDGFSLGFDQNTQAGRDNEQMLVDLAADSQAAAKAQFDLDGNTANYKKTLENGRQAVIDRAVALGATKDQAIKLADSIYKIPTKREFEMVAKTQAAAAMIANFKNMVASIPGSKIVSVGVQLAPNSHPGLDPFKLPKKADGGAITGSGGPRQDNHLVWMSAGEHVLDAEDVRRMGGQEAVYRFRAGLGGETIRYGSSPQYANGGASGSSSVSVNPQVSLAGATLMMSVDGRQIRAVIQEQIVSTQNSTELMYARGRQVR